MKTIEVPERAIRMEYRVPYADTDMMGYVYYGNYLTLFERSRNELMRASGFTYARMETEGGAMLPVVEAHGRAARCCPSSRPTWTTVRPRATTTC